MKKIIPFIIAAMLFGCSGMMPKLEHTESAPTYGTKSTGDSYTSSEHNELYNAVVDNDTRLDTIEALGGIVWSDGDGTYTEFAISTAELDRLDGITGALYYVGGTDVAVTDGGTGSSTAAGARTNLGLGTASTRAAEDTLTDGSNLPDGAAIKAYNDTNYASITHASRHIDDGADPLDGDKIEITWTPDVITPDSSPAECSADDQLCSILEGFEDYLAAAAWEEDTHASEHGKDGADPIDRYFEGETITALTPGDSTPTVVSRNIYDCTGGTTVTITDFDMTGVAVGDYFGVLMNDSDVTIDFSANSDIEGNGNVDFTGSSSQIVFLIFSWTGSYWIEENLNVGMSDGTTISIRSITTMTLEASELEDTSDPHSLVAAELGGVYLSNAESVGADEWDFPARAEGWDFCFIKEADQNVTLDPNGTEQWQFRTDNSGYTQLSAGEAIVNTTAGESVICCFSTETAVYCTGDANWAEETP